MSTTPAQIDVWRQSRSETQRLEFKEAKNQYDFGKLCKYCVALANEGGGVLLFGIEDKPPRKVVGSQAVNDPVGMAEKLFTAVGFRVDIEAVQHPDGLVVVFHIPSRPRGTAYHLAGQYLMRSGEELCPMSEDRLRAIFDEGKPEWLEEPARSGLTAQQVIELLDTQSMFQLLGLPYPTAQTGVIDKLKAERLIDDSSDGFVIRRMGAVLLARQLIDFPDVSRKAARIVQYAGDSKLKTTLDRTWDTGYAAGFRNLIAFLMGLLPQNEVVEQAIRKQVKLVPEIVIRELVANALIHQDFTASGTSVMAEVYTNRVEISNPGEPIVPVERFIDGYQSRNERLADLMRRMRICEEKSSGIDQVVDAAEKFQLPAPLFRSDFRRTTAIVFGHKAFSDLRREERIRACYQHCVMRWVKGEMMTNQSLRERFRLPSNRSASVTQVINGAIEENLIKLDAEVGDSKRFARYLPHWG